MSLRGTPCVLGQQQRDISCRHCRQCRLQVQRIYSMLSSNIHHYFTLFATFCRPGAAGFYLHFQQLVRWRAISLRVLGSFFIHFLHFMIFFLILFVFLILFIQEFTIHQRLSRDLTRSDEIFQIDQTEIAFKMPRNHRFKFITWDVTPRHGQTCRSILFDYIRLSLHFPTRL